MKSLLTDDLWSGLSVQFADHKRTRAAISYVTARHLDFKQDDMLICDASDAAIKGGLTSALLLQSFVHQGAEVLSFDGLHSKVAIIDEHAILGSANMSNNAGVNTCEASLLTDDLQIVALVRSFIEKVKGESESIDEVFLNRIVNLPVTQSVLIHKKSVKKLETGKPRVWLIGTSDLSDQIFQNEEQYHISGTEEAKKNIKQEGYETWPIRFAGASRFRTEAKEWDQVICIHTIVRGKSKRKYVEVYRPFTIVHRQDEEKWTRFYLEIPPDSPSYKWKDIHADFASLGVVNISPNSSRELTGKALGILQLME